MTMFIPSDPLLVVEESRMCLIDPQNPSALFSMWSVFSKASSLIEQGKRLEHMSWRLWAHQSIRERTRRIQRSAAAAAAAAQGDSHFHSTAEEVPRLSRSVESIASNPSRQSCTPDDGALSVGDFHDDELPAVDLTHLVVSIKQTQDIQVPVSPLPSPLNFASFPSTTKAPRGSISTTTTTQESTSTPRPSSPQPVPVTSNVPPLSLMASSSTLFNSASTEATRASASGSSATSAESSSSTHDVVRGFTPGLVTSYRSQTALAPPPLPAPVPILRSSGRSSTRVKSTKSAKFQIGSGESCESSSDGGGTLQDNLSPMQNHGSGCAASSNSAGSGSIGHAGRAPPVLSAMKKSSFLARRGSSKKTKFELGDEDEEDEDEGAIEDDSDDDYLTSSPDEDMEESAIDDEDEDEDDDEDAWEDAGEEDESTKELTFPRVDSRPELVSRRSAIWDGLHGWAGVPAAQLPGFSKSQLVLSSTQRDLQKIPRSHPRQASSKSELHQAEATQPSAVTAAPRLGPHAAAVQAKVIGPPLSPVNTRKKMINEELGVSLRKHMLNERQQRNYFGSGHSSSSNLPRRHTSCDMRQLAFTSANMVPMPVLPVPEEASSSSRHRGHHDDASASAWNAEYESAVDTSTNYHHAGW